MISSSSDFSGLSSECSIETSTHLAPPRRAATMIAETEAPVSAAAEEEVDLPLLLVAPDPPATAVAQALRRELGVRVHIASHGRSALAALRREDFQLIVLEENLAASEPDATSSVFAGARAAPVLEINFGLCGVERILRQVRSALQRRIGDEAKARRAVAHSVQNELNASLAGLLLESQLALRGAGPEILPTLQHLIELASELREQLRH